MAATSTTSPLATNATSSTSQVSPTSGGNTTSSSTSGGLINAPSPQTGSTSNVASPSVATTTPALNNSVQTVNAAQIGNTANWTVDPNQTVQGQVASIASQDSPLIHQAVTNANEAMNSRGLLNSSMGVGAAENAAVQAALPIAQQDAQTYNNATGYNVGQQNQATAANVAAQNQTAQFNATATNNQSLQNQQAINSANQANAAAANQNSLQQYLSQMDAATKNQVANVSGQYQTLTQTSQSAAAIQQQVYKNIADIAANASMTPAAKQQATNNQIQLYQQSLSTLGAISNLNLSNLLTFSSQPVV